MTTNPAETPNENAPQTDRLPPEKRAALLAVAGRRKNDATADEWFAEIARYREQIQKDEIAAQDASNKQ